MTAVANGVVKSQSSARWLVLSILFSNHSDRFVTVDSYEVACSRGQRLFSDVGFRIDPRGEVSRTCNLDPIPLDDLAKDDFRVAIRGSRYTQ